MKADSCGTLVEQVRYKMGWINAAERKAKVSAGELKPGQIAGEKCACCAHLNPVNINACDLGHFATRPNCYCSKFQHKGDSK